MKIIITLLAGILFPALCGCDGPVVESEAAASPPVPDAFAWPAAQANEIEFETVGNADLAADVRKAAATLEAHFSPESVTYARTDLNHDGRAEMLIKVHHYGFAPRYAILTLDDSGEYSKIGLVSGDPIFLCTAIDGWLQLEGRGVEIRTRRLFAYEDGLYDLQRAELLDPATGKVTILLPQKAEKDGSEQPATRPEWK